MSDNRSRHDRLAVRLSLIISRLMAGESLSLKTLSDEFGVIRHWSPAGSFITAVAGI